MRGAQYCGQCEINMETKNKPQEQETNKKHDEGRAILMSM
jgi:hypothetical protein